jgi:hypothetical protein
MWGLGYQGVELFDCGEAFCPLLPYQLAFLQHVHELDPGQRRLCGLERFEPQHGTRHPLDGAMVLFHYIIQILHLPDGDVGAVYLAVAFDGGVIGLAAIDGNRLGDPVSTDRLRQKAQRGLCIPVLGEQNVNRLTGLIYRPIQITLRPFDPNVGLVHAPAAPHRTLAAVEYLFQ